MMSVDCLFPMTSRLFQIPAFNFHGRRSYFSPFFSLRCHYPNNLSVTVTEKSTYPPFNYINASHQVSPNKWKITPVRQIRVWWNHGWKDSFHDLRTKVENSVHFLKSKSIRAWAFFANLCHISEYPTMVYHWKSDRWVYAPALSCDWLYQIESYHIRHDPIQPQDWIIIFFYPHNNKFAYCEWAARSVSVWTALKQGPRRLRLTRWSDQQYSRFEDLYKDKPVQTGLFGLFQTAVATRSWTLITNTEMPGVSKLSTWKLESIKVH